MKLPDSAKNKKALFILNPGSGVPPVNFVVSKDLDRRKNDLCVKRTNTREETGVLIRENYDKHKVFIAAGGDGTVHTVATELVNTDKILGVYPLGSGNGFAREFGFSLNIRALLSSVRKEETMEIDVIEINDMMCLNVAGIGLDSFVAHSFNDLRMRGILPYIWLTLKTFLQLRPFPIVIRIEGEEVISEDLFVFTIANTRQFGNNAFIAPDARPNDGIVDLVLVKPFPKILGPVFIIRLFTKRINQSRYVRHIKTDKEVSIETRESRFHIDGEPFSITGEVTVRIKKKVLKVLKTKGNKFLVQS